MDAAELPIFPLGGVLFPRAVLPLHVFEPRFRALVEACLSGEPEFGVVLIERGSEVGGGETRTQVGTVARIVQIGRTDDGRYVLATIGTDRFRVVEWLPDDPYPRAMVERFDDDVAGPQGEAGLDLATVAARARVDRSLQRVLSLQAELGAPDEMRSTALGPSRPKGERADVETSDELGRYTFDVAALAGLSPLDAQSILMLTDPTARLRALDELLSDAIEVLRFRLGSG
ncbi:MAG: ATP-dependent protease [Actinomycetia bacterium]|nr:ATP-dependent protease [Actinomycetes bacterium]